MVLNKKKKNYSAKSAVGVACIISSGSVLVFFSRFDFNFNAPINSWIDTATYFNNLLSPIFLFITILLLYWTWKDTKKGLFQQSEDNKFNCIVDSTVKFSEGFKLETASITYMDGLSNAYMLFLDGKLTDEHKEKLPKIYLALKENESNITIASTFFYKQYSQISNKDHQVGFKLNLFGVLGKNILSSVILIKLGVKKNLGLKGYNTDDIVAEIDFLKSVALIAHDDENEKLKKAYFNDIYLDYFHELVT